MAATTDILAMASGPSANVETQAAYASDPILANGFQSGTAPSASFNKVLRQCSFMAAGLANFIVNRGISVPDDGNLANLVNEILEAMNAVLSLSVAGGANVTLNATTQANYPIIELTGALTGNIHVTFPLAGRWLVYNNTTGAFTITLMSAGLGTSYVIPQGDTIEVYSPDGVNIIPVLNPASQHGIPYDLAGGFAGVQSVASQLALQFISTRALAFPVSLTGSQAIAGTAATASTTFTVSVNGTNVGTINWAAGATVGTFTAATAFSVAAGQVVKVTGPATPDTTLANVSFTLNGSIQ